MGYSNHYGNTFIDLDFQTRVGKSFDSNMFVTFNKLKRKRNHIMKRYIIEFNKDNISSYTPRTVYVPCGEPVQLLFTVKGETGNQMAVAGSITLKDATGTETKTEDKDVILFTIPQSTDTYSVSSFTFENGITYDTEINGSIGLNGGVTLVFSNVLVKPVPPESISYIDVGGGGGGGGGSYIECESLTATSQMDGTTTTISGGDGTISNGDSMTSVSTEITPAAINMYGGSTGACDIVIDSGTGEVVVGGTSVGSGYITIGSTALDEQTLQALIALLQN